MWFIRNWCLDLRKAIGLSSSTGGRSGNTHSSYSKKLRNEVYALPICRRVCSTTQLTLTTLCKVPRQLLWLFALKSFGILTFKLAVWCWRMDPSEIWWGFSTVWRHLPAEDSTQETDEVSRAEDGNFFFFFPAQREVGVNLNWWGQDIFSIVFLSNYY